MSSFIFLKFPLIGKHFETYHLSVRKWGRDLRKNSRLYHKHTGMIIECSFTVLERRGDSRLIKHVHKWRIVSLYPLYRVVDTAYCPRARGGVYSAHLKSKGSHANTIHPPISEGISERVLISPNFLSRPFPGWEGVGHGTLCHNDQDTNYCT